MCDAAQSGTAVSTVLINNECTRVTQWSFPNRGDVTGWHGYAYDYAVLLIEDRVLEINDSYGVITRPELKAGVSYSRDLGVDHHVIGGKYDGFAFTEGEFLDSAKVWRMSDPNFCAQITYCA